MSPTGAIAVLHVAGLAKEAADNLEQPFVDRPQPGGQLEISRPQMAVPDIIGAPEIGVAEFGIEPMGPRPDRQMTQSRCLVFYKLLGGEAADLRDAFAKLFQRAVRKVLAGGLFRAHRAEQLGLQFQRIGVFKRDAEALDVEKDAVAMHRGRVPPGRDARAAWRVGL